MEEATLKKGRGMRSIKAVLGFIAGIYHPVPLGFFTAAMVDIVVIYRYNCICIFTKCVINKECTTKCTFLSNTAYTKQ